MTLWVVTILTGCGDEIPTEDTDTGNETSIINNENQELDSLFPGTIFDGITVGKSSVQDVEALLNERVVEYVSDGFQSGKTTITDDFYEWNAKYRYVYDLGEIKENNDYTMEDMVIYVWTVELFLDSDSEYRDSVKRIQSTIDENCMAEYATVDGYYSDDIIEGNVTYYPIQHLQMCGIDCIEYIMLGKFANCNIEDAKHMVVFSVGITSEELYQKGEIVMENTIEMPKVEVEVLEIDDSLVISSELNQSDYCNVAFLLLDEMQLKGIHSRSISIFSVHEGTGNMKLVSIPRGLYLNIGNGKYGKCSEAYPAGGIEQTVRMLNQNLDMNIEKFIAIDFKELSRFIDTIGGVWTDVDLEGNEQSYDSYKGIIMSLLECEEPIALDNGYQLLNGNQVAAYSYLNEITGYTARQNQLMQDIHKQLSETDEVVLKQAIDECINNIYTNMDAEEMQNIANYSLTDAVVFPQDSMSVSTNMGSKGKCIIPTDLESNVIWLHQFLFGQENYNVSSTVKEYSEQIKEDASKYVEN